MNIAEGGANNGADWTTTDELVVGATGKAHGLSRVSVGRRRARGVHPARLRQGRAGPPVADRARRTGDHVVFTIWTGAPGNGAARDGVAGRRRGHSARSQGDPAAGDARRRAGLRAGGRRRHGGPARRRAPAGRPGSPCPCSTRCPSSPRSTATRPSTCRRGGALVTGLQARRAHLMWIGRDGVSRRIGPEVRDFSSPACRPTAGASRSSSPTGPRATCGSTIWRPGHCRGSPPPRPSPRSNGARDGTRVVYSAVGNGTSGAVWAQSIGGARGTARAGRDSRPDAPSRTSRPTGGRCSCRSASRTGWDVQRVSLDSAARSGLRRLEDGGRVLAALFAGRTLGRDRHQRVGRVRGVRPIVSGADGEGPGVGRRRSRRRYGPPTARASTTRRAPRSSRRGSRPQPGLRVVSRDTAFRQITNAPEVSARRISTSARDGSRIVIPSSESTAYPLVVVPNWLTEFRQRLAASRK